MRIRRLAIAVLPLLLAGCTLYNEVVVGPLLILPSGIERGTDVQSMLRRSDYRGAIEFASAVDARSKPNAVELAALGSAYLAAGRFDDARSRLRTALDLDPFRSTYAEIAWDLSQVEYLANNYESSYEWAQVAIERGLSIRPWHLKYLQALANVPCYSFSGSQSERVPLRFGHPEVPRIDAKLNGIAHVEAIIDSGAVVSIVSTRMAERLKVRSLGDFEGTFYGLLGEPIQVRFGLIDTLQLGDMTIENVPVAIMPDHKMRFLVSGEGEREFRMDFLLGANLLKEFRLELDFNHDRATFTHLTPADRRPAADQNLFFEGFRPHVRGAVNRRGWYLFVLDTGSEITFLNQRRLEQLPVSLFGSGVHSATLQGLGGSMKRGGKIENVEVGLDKWAGTFKTLPMYESGEHESAVGIIGQNFLQNFNVVIDFGQMRVDLKRR